MKIQYKMIEHQRTQDSNFVGALISAIGCNFKCKGCHNRDLKKLETLTADSVDIISEIKSNVFNEGIIFGGLEWSEQVIELMELIEKASNAGLKIMIQTGCDIATFQSRIGRACADKIGFDTMLTKKMLCENDTPLYAMIGAMILDYYIKDDYYIKTGKYDRDKKSVGRVQFGVTLASDNQMIYKIQKTEKSNNENYCEQQSID